MRSTDQHPKPAFEPNLGTVNLNMLSSNKLNILISVSSTANRLSHNTSAAPSFMNGILCNGEDYSKEMGVKRLNLERLMVTSVAKGGTQNFQNFQM
jgi:hypothetical protein